MSSISDAESPTMKTTDAMDYASPSQAQPPSKRRAARVSRACDFCHSRSIRCRQDTSEPGRCQSCIEYQRACTYDRPSKKRGVKSNATRNAAAASQPSNPTPKSESQSQFDMEADFTAPDILDHDTIMSLTRIYFETIYPVFPCFHRPTLYQRLNQREYLSNQAFRANVVAMASLTVARIRDFAACSDRWYKYDISNLPASQELASMAKSILPKNASAALDFDYMRAAAFLVLTALQNDELPEVHMWMGAYYTLVRIDGLQNEAWWPKDMTLVQVEERRRLFWSMYTFDVLCALCFDTMVCCRESQIRVRYPHAIDDERLAIIDTELKNSAFSALEWTPKYPEESSDPMWLQGWNFTVDLYRVLEQTIEKRREKETTAQFVSAAQRFGGSNKDQNPHAILEEVMKSYHALSQAFTVIREITFDPVSDLFGFQAASICATIQLLRIKLLSSEHSVLEENLRILSQMVESFSKTPWGYFKALSAPMVFHIAAIGSSVNTEDDVMSQGEYFECRNALLGLTGLLTTLSRGTMIGDRPANSIRNKVKRLDQHMQPHLPVQMLTDETLSLAIPQYFSQQTRPRVHMPFKNPLSTQTMPTPTNTLDSGSRMTGVASDDSIGRNSMTAFPSEGVINSPDGITRSMAAVQQTLFSSGSGLGMQLESIPTTAGISPTGSFQSPYYAPFAEGSGGFGGYPMPNMPYQPSPSNMADNDAWAFDIAKSEKRD